MPTDSSRVFVIGVPRSGATLLLVSPHSPPGIAADLEPPWFCAHHPRTVGALVAYLCDDPLCYCANFDGNHNEVFAAARVFVDTPRTSYSRRKGKRATVVKPLRSYAAPRTSYSRRKGKRLWTKGSLDNPQFDRDPRRNGTPAPSAEGVQGHLIHYGRAANGKWDAAGANVLISYGVPVPAGCARIGALRISRFKCAA